MRVSKLLQNTFYIAISCFIISCEGFKFISIENKSKANITVITNPGISSPEPGEYPKTYESRVDTILTLPPDSTMLIPTYFGPLNIFNEKIKQEELRFAYLKIISGTDTLVVNNKEELFKLLKRRRNLGKIIVR